MDKYIFGQIIKFSRDLVRIGILQHNYYQPEKLNEKGIAGNYQVHKVTFGHIT